MIAPLISFIVARCHGGHAQRRFLIRYDAAGDAAILTCSRSSYVDHGRAAGTAFGDITGILFFPEYADRAPLRASSPGGYDFASRPDAPASAYARLGDMVERAWPGHAEEGRTKMSRIPIETCPLCHAAPLRHTRLLALPREMRRVDTSEGRALN